MPKTNPKHPCNECFKDRLFNMEIGKVEIIDYCFRCPINKPKEKPMEIKYNKMEIKNYEEKPMENKIETESEKCQKCKNNGLKCAMCLKDTLSNFEPLENKVIFESEEEARSFFNRFIWSDTNGECLKRFIENLKYHNAIRKSAVEEAEEMYNEKCKDRCQTTCEEYLYEAIQELKSENERLKK